MPVSKLIFKLVDFVNCHRLIGLNIERMLYSKILETQDRIEGLKAFIEKRKPQYKGE